jgi:HK97 family phage prohead protease
MPVETLNLKIEHKIVQFKNIAITTDPSDEFPHGGFEGYASTFGNVDRVGEAVIKGAFLECLDEFLKSGFIAVGHGWSALAIGAPMEAKEDDIGLYLKAAFYRIQAAQDARAVMLDRQAFGKDSFLSIGYQVLEDEFTDNGRRLLKKLLLREVSFVNVPANPLAAITGAKGFYGMDYTENDLRLLSQEFKFDSSLGGLSFLEHTNVVHEANLNWVQRVKSILELRAAKSQQISPSNLGRLHMISKSLGEVLESINTLIQPEIDQEKKDETGTDVTPLVEETNTLDQKTAETAPVLESEPPVVEQVLEPEIQELGEKGNQEEINRRAIELRAAYLKQVSRQFGVQI